MRDGLADRLRRHHRAAVEPAFLEEHVEDVPGSTCHQLQHHDEHAAEIGTPGSGDVGIVFRRQQLREERQQPEADVEQGLVRDEGDGAHDEEGDRRADDVAADQLPLREMTPDQGPPAVGAHLDDAE
jgi:hypothetical protein